MSLLLATLLSLSASAHHFTNTTTGQTVRHFPSAKVLGNKSVRVYFKLHAPLAQGETLVARWTPPTIDGTCRVYEYALAADASVSHVTSQRWNSAKLAMFCPGEWTCEILIRKQGRPDVTLHETQLVAHRRKVSSIR